MLIKNLKHKKKGLLIILSLVVFLIAVRLLLVFLRPKTSDGIKQAAYMYAQPKDTIDVVCMGSSHVLCGVNPQVLWDEYGIASYDYAAAEQPLWLTYYYMKEICRYQKPKVIVLDMFSPARFKDDYQYRWLSDNLNGVRFSPNKLRMALAGCEKNKIFDYFPSFYNYHGRYDEIGMDDINEMLRTDYTRSAYKGYNLTYKVEERTVPDFETSEQGGLTDKSEEYLDKIIEYAEEQNIELCWIVIPYSITEDDERTYNQLDKIAKENNIPFSNYNINYEQIGLDYKSDFSDYSHLNYYGGCKFTRFLAQELKERYDIPDRRGDKRWESWDRQEYEERGEN